MAMPKIAPIHHAHDIRFAIAIPPSAMMRMIATGVSHAKMFVCRDVAPVINGEEDCAIAIRGGPMKQIAPTANVAILVRASCRSTSWRIMESPCDGCGRSILGIRSRFPRPLCLRDRAAQPTLHALPCPGRRSESSESRMSSRIFFRLPCRSSYWSEFAPGQ
jgi:hypothetical protein